VRFCFATRLTVITIFTKLVFACSGLGVGDLIDANVHLSRQLFVVACFLVTATAVVALLRKTAVRLLIAVLAAGLLAVHPAFTVSAAGDCGALKVMSSLRATGLLAVICFVQLTLGSYLFSSGRRTTDRWTGAE
jgi:hypothetical protein